jgi:hypothetical protein
MTLVKFDNGQTLLVDLHVRRAADDPENDETPDVMAELRSRLETDDAGRPYVDGFLLSHPDKDHIGGLEEHFHLGPLADYDSDGDKIVIREMWSSPIVFRRASTEHTLCDDAKAWAKEARRRVQYYRDYRWAGDGDRILIMADDVDGKTDDIADIVVKVEDKVTMLNGTYSGAFEARLLGPLPPDEDECIEDQLAKNRSSVILRFSIRGENVLDQCRFLTGGDAEVAIWERLWLRHGDMQADWLTYDVLQAPHHCSWHSLSYDSITDLGDKAKVNEGARSALSQTRTGAIVVASSEHIDPEDCDPPSDRAKQEYVDIVGAESRFICVADVWDEKGVCLEYEVTAHGTVKKAAKVASTAVKALGIGAVASEARAHGRR